MTLRLRVLACTSVALLTLSATAQTTLTFQPDDRVVFVGNAFAERLQQHSYFETLLSSHFADLDLTFRNMGWSGDTAARQPRALNFGDLHTHLTEQEADVVFVFFGMNESFEGEAGLAAFERDLSAFVDTLTMHRYNGETPPRIVLVSPIAQEEQTPSYLDIDARNRDLAQYADAVRRVARRQSAAFIDLFAPTRRLMTDEAVPPLTSNGIHLNAFGDWVVSQLMADALGVPGPDAVVVREGASGSPLADVEQSGTGVSFRWDGPGLAVPPPPDSAQAPAMLRDRQPRLVVPGLAPGSYALRIEGRVVATADAEDWARGVPVYPQQAALREIITDKNQTFFYRWRAVNGEYIYGRRREPFGVEHFPQEMAQLDAMVADAEARIHAFADAPLGQPWRLERVEVPQ